MTSPEANAFEWPSAEEKARNVAQAIALREQAKAGGLRFSVYLPPDLADWLLGLVEKGTFIDPSEAVFVKLQEAQELEPHHDLRRELLTRMLLQAAEERPASADSWGRSAQADKRKTRVVTRTGGVGETQAGVAVKSGGDDREPPTRRLV